MYINYHSTCHWSHKFEPLAHNIAYSHPKHIQSNILDQMYIFYHSTTSMEDMLHIFQELAQRNPPYIRT